MRNHLGVLNGIKSLIQDYLEAKGISLRLPVSPTNIQKSKEKMDNKDESKLLVEALDKIVAHQEHCGHHNSFIANTAKRALLEHAAQKEWNNIWNLCKGDYHNLKTWYVASICASGTITQVSAQNEWDNIWNLSKGEYHKLKAWYLATMRPPIFKK